MHETKQRALELLRQEPLSRFELAEKLDISDSHARDGIIGGLRDAGFDIEYNHSTNKYELLDAAPDDDQLAGLLEEGVTPDDVDSLDDRIADLEQQGYEIETRQVDGTTEYYIPDKLDNRHYLAGTGDGQYRFALTGDTHLGSVAEHLDELHEFYDIVQDRGIKTVFHAGDVTDGWKVYQGHVNEIKGEAANWDRLLNYTVENYPNREGVDTHFIEGNHDHKFRKRNGMHLGKLLDQRRPDMHFRGDSMARFVFDPSNDIDLELIHPSGGKPYTEGYRAQTLYRERPVDKRPTLAGIGHLHGSMYTHTEGVKCWYVGSWKGLTTYGKRKGHDSCIGGWIINLRIAGGQVRSVSMEEISFESKDTTQEFEAQV